MYNFFINLFLLIILLVLHSHAQKITLQDDIADAYLDEYSKIEAAFILSGITNPDSLQRHLDWYDELLQHIDRLNLDNMDPISSAHTVFLYLHTTWLKTYALESTTLADIVRTKCANAKYIVVVEMNMGQILQAVKLALHEPERVFLANRIDGEFITDADIRDVLRLIQGRGV